MPLNGHRNELALALAALASGKNGEAVFIAREGMARQSSVVPGLENGVWVEITEGLQEETDGVVIGKSWLHRRPSRADIALQSSHRQASQPGDSSCPQKKGDV